MRRNMLGQTLLTYGRLMVLGFGLCAPVAVSSALGADGDSDRGKELAERLCAECHAIGAYGESTHRDAMPLRDLAAKWPVEYLEEAFAEGIVVGHPDMPEFALHPDHIADLLAYIDSLEIP